MPNPVNTPSASAILLNRSLHHQTLGHEQVRVCVYPYTIREDRDLSSIRFSGDSIKAEIQSTYQSLQENPQQPLNEHLRDLSGINHLNGDAISRDIPFNEIMALFSWKDDHWQSPKEKYLEELRLAILRSIKDKNDQDRFQKKELLEHAKLRTLNHEDYPVLYRLIRTLSPDKVLSILTKNKKHFDVLVLDARHGMLKSHQGWIKSAAKLISNFDKNNQMPSVVVLTEDIEIYQRLEYAIHQYRDADSKKRFEQYCWYQPDMGMVKKESLSSELLPFPDFNAAITGSHYLSSLSRLDDLAKAATGSPLRTLIYRTIQFLARILNTPVPQRDVNHLILEMVNERRMEREGQRLGRFVSWDLFKADINNQAITNNLNDDPAFHDYINTASELVTQVRDEPPLARHLKSILENNFSRRLLIVIDQHCLGLEEIISEYLSNLVEADKEVKVLHKHRLLSHLAWAEHIIYAGMNEGTLKSLITLEPGNARITILAHAYVSFKLERHLRFITQRSGFSNLHLRANQLLEEISPQVQSIRLNQDEILLPDDLVFTSQQPTHSSSNGDSHYADVVIEDYGLLDVGKNSKILRATPKSKLPFEMITVNQLREGDEICLTEEISLDGFIDKAISGRAKKASTVLQDYFSLAAECIKKHFLHASHRRIAEAVKQRMLQLNPVVAESVGIQSLMNWIENILLNSQGLSPDIRTVSPRDKDVFFLFTQALEIYPQMAEQFWALGIRNLRSARVLEGRQFYQNIKHILTSHYIDGAEIEGLSEEEYAELIDMAIHCCYQVEAIHIQDMEIATYKD